MTTNAPDSIKINTRHTVKELSRAVELRASPTTNHEHQPLHGHDLCRLMGGTKEPPQQINLPLTYIHFLLSD